MEREETIKLKKERKHNGAARVARAVVPTSRWKTTFGSQKGSPCSWPEALPQPLVWFQQHSPGGYQAGPAGHACCLVRQRGEATDKQRSGKCPCRRYTQPSGGDSAGTWADAIEAQPRSGGGQWVLLGPQESLPK
ncbi:unnamed protein product [Rangifer tarandus platyrhynchus]|uniref:Uncharacterized protein n=2 Tax=Rangifer tarandus platyrhynchus TaxID=3082113 RepID=A0ABN8XWJ5_RANTA|nr:unnamed protein product [Rangifer tarandus platyrhynchus]